MVTPPPRASISNTPGEYTHEFSEIIWQLTRIQGSSVQNLMFSALTGLRNTIQTVLFCYWWFRSWGSWSECTAQCGSPTSRCDRARIEIGRAQSHLCSEYEIGSAQCLLSPPPLGGIWGTFLLQISAAPNFIRGFWDFGFNGRLRRPIREILSPQIWGPK